MIETPFFDNGRFMMTVTQPKYMCPDFNHVVFKVAMKHYSTEYPAIAALTYEIDYESDCSFDYNNMITQ